MTNEELITRQQKRIHELEDALKSIDSFADGIRHWLICIGGPLNDNVLQYSKEQRKPLHRILEAADEIVSITDETGVTERG